jgi:hypothetical protein
MPDNSLKQLPKSLGLIRLLFVISCYHFVTRPSHRASKNLKRNLYLKLKGNFPDFGIGHWALGNGKDGCEG